MKTLYFQKKQKKLVLLISGIDKRLILDKMEWVTYED